MTLSQQLVRHKLIAIIRGAQPEEVPPIAIALYRGGIRAVEVTLNSAAALDVIRRLSVTRPGELLVGAGTVLDAASAEAAMDAGAQFIISPSFDAGTVRITKERGRVSIPGAFTATEIVAAHRAGADLVKVFPASSPQYIKDLKGPLDHIPMMPTGGVTLENIADFQKAGGVAFGIGSALVDTKQKITPAYLDALTEKAARFLQAVNPS